MNDDILWQCNESELLQMTRAQGLGHLRRGLPRDRLIALVTGNEKELEDKGITVGGIEYQTLGKPYEIERMLSLVKKYAR